MRPAGINKDWISNPIYHFDINPWWWTGVSPCATQVWRKKNKYGPEQFPKWLSEGCWVPYAGYTKLAAVLALSDTNETSGGF